MTLFSTSRDFLLFHCVPPCGTWRRSLRITGCQRTTLSNECSGGGLYRWTPTLRGCGTMSTCVSALGQQKAPHTHSPKCTCSNFIRVDNIRVHISVGGMDCVLLSRCPSQQCPYIRRSYGHFRNFNWLSRKSTLNLKLQRKFAFGKPLARFRQLHFSTIDKRKNATIRFCCCSRMGVQGLLEENCSIFQ
jgi:hypothetical protein